MISYHTNFAMSKDIPAWQFTRGFLVANVQDLNRIAKCMSKCAWCPGIFWNGHRKEEFWIGSQWIGLDFDDAEMTLAEACNIFSDQAHVIGTTLTHQKEKLRHRENKDGTRDEWVEAPRDRFRVLLKCDEFITNLAVYRHQLATYMDKYPVDDKCKDGARFFYPCKEIVSINHDGYLHETDIDFEDKTTWYNEMREMHIKTGTIPSYIRTLLINPMKEHTKNNGCFRIAAALYPLGYSADEIYRLIENSPTYHTIKIEQRLEREIKATIRNGIKASLKK